MTLLWVVLTVLFAPLRQETEIEMPAVDTVLHIEFRNASGHAVVDTPVTYKASNRRHNSNYELGCVTDKKGNCDIHVQFDVPTPAPSIFGQLYVHSKLVRSAIFLIGDSEATYLVLSGENRLNPHESIHSEDEEPVPYTNQATVSAMFTMVAAGMTPTAEQGTEAAPIEAAKTPEAKVESAPASVGTEAEEETADPLQIEQPEQSEQPEKEASNSGRTTRIIIGVAGIAIWTGIVAYVVKRRV